MKPADLVCFYSKAADMLFLLCYCLVSFFSHVYKQSLLYLSVRKDHKPCNGLNPLDTVSQCSETSEVMKENNFTNPPEKPSVVVEKQICLTVCSLFAYTYLYRKDQIWSQKVGVY